MAESRPVAEAAVRNLVSLLPHRAPLLLLDNAEIRDDGSLISRQVIPTDGPMLRAHFPGLPVWPGALLIEAMAQTTAVWLLSQRGGLAPDEIPLLGAVDARFLKPVLPGAVIWFETRRVCVRHGLGLFSVVAAEDADTVVARARVSAAIKRRATVFPPKR